MVVKTGNQGKNRQHVVLKNIHNLIKKIVLSSGGSQIGFVTFIPHCSLAAVPASSFPLFLKIEKDLIQNATYPASQVSLEINPSLLQFRIHPLSKTN
jgi:hypothetical protein